MNLHPALSSLPTAILLLVLILEVFNRWVFPSKLDHAIRISIIFAAISVGAAFLSGYGAAESADQTFKISDDLISAHHSFGRVLLFAVIPCAILRFIVSMATHGRRVLDVIYLILLLAVIALSIFTGYRGGELVFKYGAGVYAEK